MNQSDGTNWNISFVLFFLLFSTSFDLRSSSEENFLKEKNEKKQQKWTGNVAYLLKENYFLISKCLQMTP